jgi:N-acetylmuramoyl-L-alanine amidase
MNKYLFLLDAGHGGMLNGVPQTKGKRSPLWEDGTQYFEGVGNRVLVQKIKQKCQEAGIDVMDIVSSQRDIPLYERVERANALQYVRPCIYISIHSDAFSKESANGYSVYTSKGNTKSDKIATIFLANMMASFPNHKLRKDTSDGDLDKEANFYVLKYTKCPAILIENFFMTNREECKLLMSESGQERIATSHFKSILEIDRDLKNEF